MIVCLFINLRNVAKVDRWVVKWSSTNQEMEKLISLNIYPFTDRSFSHDDSKHETKILEKNYLLLVMSLKKLKSMAYSFCHAPIPMTS